MKTIKETIYSHINENIDNDIKQIIKRIDELVKANNIDYDDFIAVFVDTFCNTYKHNGDKTLNHVLDRMF